MAKPEDKEKIDRVERGHVRKVDISPSVKLDLDVLMPGVEAAIDEFLADREAAEKTLPDRQAMLDRAAVILGNVDPTKLVGINSLGANKHITIHHRDSPPYFTMGTSGD